MTIFGTRILQWISYFPCISHSLYNQRRGTSLSFKSTVGQHIVYTHNRRAALSRDA